MNITNPVCNVGRRTTSEPDLGGVQQKKILNSHLNKKIIIRLAQKEITLPDKIKKQR